jgi:hypothetical protein
MMDPPEVLPDAGFANITRHRIGTMQGHVSME